MNDNASGAEQGAFFDLGSHNNHNTSNNFGIQDTTQHGLHDGENLLALLALPDMDSQYSFDQMANEAAKAELPSEHPNKVSEEDLAAASTWKQEINDVLESGYTNVHGHAQASSNTGPTASGNSETSQRPGLSNIRHNSEQRFASPNSTPTKRTGTPSIPLGQRPRTTTTSSHGEGSSDDDKAHSLASTATSAMSSHTMNDRSAQSRMGLNSVLHSSGSAPTNGRQPLQHQFNRIGSNLRYMSNPGESEAQSSFRPSAQPLDQGHNQGSFATAHSPQASHTQSNKMGRGQPGPPQSHRPNGYYVAEGAYSPYTGRAQVYQGHGYSYYAGSPSTQSHSSSLPHLSRDVHQGTLHGALNHPVRDMGILSQPAMQHFQPYGHDFEIHRNLGQHGYGGLKQEDSSPKSMASVPTIGDTGFETDAPPDRRTLADLEPNPTFDDDEDKARLLRILGAMMDMPSAQDNEGMKKTWTALSKDRAKVQLVCKKVLNACYVSQNINAPLQSSVKPQHHYETLDERIDAVCEAFKQQKTMCKHLMEAPYLYQVVDDPNLAAMRVINNRKVNKGKKEAIEQGRKALKEKAKSRGQPFPELKTETEDEFQDDGREDSDFEEDEETYPELHGIPSYAAPGPNYANPVNKRGRQMLARHMSSDDSTDPTYGVPPPKKAKKTTSMYQLNDRNEMVDTSTTRKGHRTSQPISRRAIQNRRSSQTYQPTLSDYNNSGTELDSDNAAMGYSGWSEEDFQRGMLEYH